LDNITKYLNRIAYKFPKGYPDMNNDQDVLLLETLLSEFLGEKFQLNESIKYDVLKNLAGESIDDETLKRIQNGDDFGINIETVRFSSGGSGRKYGGQDSYNLNDLRKIIGEFEKPLILTYAGTVRKLRTPFSIRICTFSPPKNEQSIDFKRLIAISRLIDENPDKIKVVPKVAPGLGYEAQQVDNLNKNLTDILSQLGNDSVRLYVQGKDQGVEISTSEKVQGSGKADLVLLNKGKEVYWISYKEGKYYTGNGVEDKELSKDIPFQQYGSLVTLYSKSYNEEMQEFSRYLGKEIPDFLDSVITNSDSKYVFEGITPSELESSSEIPEDIIEFTDQLRWKQLKSFAGNDKVDVCFIPPKTQFKRNFLKTGDRQSAILAGKSVWGLDYNGSGKDFGRENNNILLQNDGVINLTPRYKGEEIIGIDITPTNTGHVLFNPELPIDNSDPDYIYTPALNVRHTKAESFAYESNGRKKMILAGRVLIIPLGRLDNVPEV
jgi:hypothetical protein